MTRYTRVVRAVAALWFVLLAGCLTASPGDGNGDGRDAGDDGVDDAGGGDRDASAPPGGGAVFEDAFGGSALNTALWDHPVPTTASSLVVEGGVLRMETGVDDDPGLVEIGSDISDLPAHQQLVARIQGMAFGAGGIGGLAWASVEESRDHYTIAVRGDRLVALRGTGGVDDATILCNECPPYDDTPIDVRRRADATDVHYEVLDAFDDWSPIASQQLEPGAQIAQMMALTVDHAGWYDCVELPGVSDAGAPRSRAAASPRR